MKRLEKHNNLSARTLFCGSLAALLALVATDGVRAQHRTSGDGRLLDANPRLGSGGKNNYRTRNRQLTDPLYNNLLITGNVTGGRSFKGDVGYRSPYEFQGDLGSTTLSDFMRDSVGSGSFSGGLGASQPYLPSSRGLGRSLGGGIVNTGDVANSQSPALGAPIRQPEVYTNPFSSPAGGRSSNILDADPLAAPREYDGSALGAAQTTSPWGSPLPKVSGAIDTTSSASPFAQQLRRTLQREAGPGKLSPGETGVPFGQDNENLELDLDENDSTEDAPVDPFIEFLQKQQADEEEPEELQSSAAPGPGIEPITDSDYKSTAKLLRAYVRRGEKLMHQREYYHAANAFSRASFYTSQKGTIGVAKALALFGAGDFYDAAFNLNTALKQSPRLAGKKVPFERYFPRLSDATGRIKELKERQELAPAANLSILAAFVQYQLGRYSQAQVSLAELDPAEHQAAYVKIMRHAITEAHQATPPEKAPMVPDDLPEYDEMPGPVDEVDP